MFMAQAPVYDLSKQWDVKSIGVEAVGLSYWGMHPELMGLLLQLPDIKAMDLHPDERDLISYPDLKRVLTYLHGRGIDTSVLNIAARQLIDEEEAIKNTAPSPAVTNLHWARKDRYVLVVGTGARRLTPAEARACESIGQLLATEGYGLITGGWKGADQEVAEAYFRELAKYGEAGKQDLVLHYMMGGEKPADQKGGVIDIPSGTWYVHTMSRVLAVIIIGGEGLTYETYQSALRARVPVIPLVSTGGIAEKVYHEFLESKQNLVPRDLLETLNTRSSANDDTDIPVDAVNKILFFLHARAEVWRFVPGEHWLDMTDELNGVDVTYNDAEFGSGPYIRSRGKHTLQLPASFRMCKYPVTNEFYLEFLIDRGYETPRYWSIDSGARQTFTCRDKRSFGPAGWQDATGYEEGLDLHPVSGISVYEAMAFAEWMNEKRPLRDGWRWCLPPEDCWEFAARGREGTAYPWGNEFRTGLCNSSATALGTTCSVFEFDKGVSKTGCYDLSGNVWEFMSVPDLSDGHCTLRGGSYKNNEKEVDCRLRLFGVSDRHRPLDFGFRLAQVQERLNSPA
ncbi:MAG: hypothetical protein EOO05_09380 [Chitinophagaceae bacterium]|nr:MAG: hypothetical protein EOO05_09380 [Chitinophagaceae bacterium]